MKGTSFPYHVSDTHLTFFECVARFMHAHPDDFKPMNAQQIQERTLMHFADIVFENVARYRGDLRVFLRDVRSGNTKHLVLKSSCIFNGAVKAWIKRFHSVEKSVAQTPEIWYLEYPKLMKGAILRFIYYHRNYAKKPHRIYSVHVFAHLIADQLNCRVCIVAAEVARFRWFYPLDYGDYYMDASILTLLVAQEADAFSLLEARSSDILFDGDLTLLPESEGVDVAFLLE